MTKSITTEVLIVGGGPAGMLLATLLARRGVPHVVVERNADFAREYRGEVLMPRFVRLMHQLGLDDVYRGLPHRTLEGVVVHWKDEPRGRFRFSRVAPEYPYGLWIPQPVLLSAFATEAAKHPSHHMIFSTVVQDLVHDAGRVVGARCERGGESIAVRADVVVGCDGRFSSLRRLGKFEIEYEQHDFDVLWFSIPDTNDEAAAFRVFLSAPRAYLALPKHPASLQCGMLLPPNGYGAYRKAGIESLRAHLLEGPRLFHEFARAVTDFSPFTLLHANLDLVKDWERDGLVLIGDAAHTCSPAGAIGVSIACETAAVAAEVLVDCHARRDYSKSSLDRIQQRREPAIRAVHARQKALGRNFITSPIARRIGAFVVPIIQRLGLVERAIRPLAYGEPVALDM